MAHELGLFGKYGLEVELRREVGWASIRDKVIYGELDAAHSLAAMPFAATLGLGSIACECVTGLVLNLNGNAITLSEQLWKLGVRDARSLKMEIDRARGRKVYTFGVVFQFSSHNFLLRQWLASGGINPDTDVRIVVVPPPSMFANLKSGNLDGYCVGEPWNTVGIQSELGWGVTSSVRLAPGHPEKVLMVRRTFAETDAAEHLRLIAAILEACEFCDQPANREHIISTLAKPKYVNAPVECLRHSLSGSFDFGHGHVEVLPDFAIFHRNNANEPSSDKAAWVVNQLIRSGLVKDPPKMLNALNGKVFRPDIYAQAHQLISDFEGKEVESDQETVLANA